MALATSIAAAAPVDVAAFDVFEATAPVGVEVIDPGVEVFDVFDVFEATAPVDIEAFVMLESVEPVVVEGMDVLAASPVANPGQSEDA